MPLVTVQDVAEKVFDYVVIGGGSAGLVLAARLSDDSNTSILVLDAGKPNFDDPLIIRPGQYGRTFMNADYDWAFKTVPQEKLGGREVLWNRGKSLGGSSAINFSCWSVPPKEDVDDWERLGNPGWDWKTYEDCLRRVATYHSNGESDATSDIPERVEAMKPWEAGWGQGPLKISHPKNILDIEFKLQETWVKLGLPRAQASHAGSPKGVSLIANTLDPETNGRSYAATAFFKPNEARQNLEVLTSASVSRIETETVGDVLKATTVEFWHASENATPTKYSVKVKKEVILCAGALKSPQILELSGIGRPDILDSLGVEVKLPLEGVGENVQDHNFLGVTYALKDDFEGDTYDVLNDPEVAAKQVELFKEKKGVFMMGICSMAYAGLSTVSPRSEDLLKQTRERIEGEVKQHLYSNARLEQYEIIFQRLKNGSPGFEFIGFPGVLSGPNPGKAGKKYFTIIVATNYSFNRGTIHATSKDITVDPAYDPKYFDYDIDLQVIVDMVKYTRNVFKSSPLAEYLEETPVELNPGAEAQTDAEIEEWVKATIGTTYHVIGSLSMLPKEKGGVVDSNLKVYGTQNIRVADLSIVPLHFAAHSLATAYTIGQYAADVIRRT